MQRHQLHKFLLNQS